MQKVQDKMLAEVQGVQRRCRWCSLREGAGEVQVVQGGAGYLHRLHLSKHNIRCRRVQGVQAHLRLLTAKSTSAADIYKHYSS